MDNKLLSKIKVWVEIPKEPPAEYVEKWKRSMIAAGPKMAEGIKKSISGVGDYARKIGKHSIKDKIQFIKPNYRSKHGRTYKNIIDSMITNMPNGYNKFKGKTGQAFGDEAKQFSAAIEAKAYQAALKTSRNVFPFGGYKNQIRGVGPFAARWLSGDHKVLELTLPQDMDLEGGPVLITQPERAGEFRKRLINRIKQAGAQIVRYNKFNQVTIDRENAITNQLVNEYVRPIRTDVPPDGTTSNGVQVRVDFVVENDLLYLKIEVRLGLQGLPFSG